MLSVILYVEEMGNDHRVLVPVACFYCPTPLFASDNEFETKQ